MTGLEAVLGAWFAVALRITIGLALGSLIVAGLLRKFPKIPAEARHGLWMLVLLQGLLWFRIPVWLPAEAPSDHAPIATSDTPVAFPVAPPADVPFEAPPVEMSPDGPPRLTVPPRQHESHAIVAESASRPLQSTAGTWPKLAAIWKPVLAGVWVAGALSLVLVSMVRLWRFNRRVLSHSVPAPESFQEAARRLAENHGLRRKPRVLWCESAQVPMLVGLIRPTIVFPSSLIALPEHQWEPLLAHEVAHLCRRDRLFAALSSASCMLNYFNPFAWWARDRMSAAREESADRWVTQTAGYCPKHYSRGLLAVAEALCRPQPACLGAARKPSDLWHRVKALKELDADQLRGRLWPARVLSGALALAVLVSLVSVRYGSPLLAEDQPREPGGAATPAPTGNIDSPADDPAFLHAATPRSKAPQGADQTARPGRILHFPSDRSIGELYIRKPYQESLFQGWGRLGVARGDVVIPASNEVRLTVGAQACKDLSPLGQLGPDSGQVVYCIFAGPVDAEGLTNIRHLTSLKVAVFQQSVPITAVVDLANALSLESLHLQQLVDEDAAHLASIESLRGLGLSRSRVTDKGLTHVGKTTSLQRLDLSFCKITDEGLVQLKDLTSLKILFLHETPITDAGIARLADLSNLQRLTLNNTSVGDEGLVHLARLQKLETLELRGTRVTSAGLAPLASLDSLKVLMLPGNVLAEEKAFEELDQFPALQNALLASAAGAGHIQRVQSLISKGADVNARGARERTPLHAAVGFGAKFVPALLIAEGADVNARDSEGDTPLHLAARWPVHRDLLELLIAKGAKVNARNHRGDTPLHRAPFGASREGRWVVAEVLLANGADVNARDHTGSTVLHIAAQYGRNRKSLAELVLDKGALVDQKTNEGVVALHVATSNGHQDVVQLLLDRKADVNAADDRGWTALHIAARGGNRTALITPTIRSGNKGILALLIAKGADVNAKNVRSETPAHLAMWNHHEGEDLVEQLVAKGAEASSIQLAAYTGDLAKVRSLIEEGVGVDAQDGLGWTALHAAARTGQEKIVEFLIAKGASVSAKDIGGGTPLHFAVAFGQKRVVELLLKKGASLDAVSGFERRQTLLHAAAWGGSKEVAELLLRKGARVDAIFPTGWGGTPLHVAARRGHKDVVQLLLASGADVDATYIRGFTPLSFAASAGHRDVAALLIDHGADIDKADLQGRTSLAYAASAGREDVVRLLIDKGADLFPDQWVWRAVSHGWADLVELLIQKGADVNTTSGGDPLSHYAVWGGHWDVLKVLLAHGADPNAKDGWGWSLLHCVAGSTEMTKLLLDSGADPKVRESQLGLTPLHVSAKRGHKGATELLISRGADVNATDYEGRTPLRWASDQGHKEIVALLRKQGAKE